MAKFVIGVRKVDPQIGSVVVEADTLEEALLRAWGETRDGKVNWRPERIAPDYSIVDAVHPDYRADLTLSFFEARRRDEES